MACQVSRKALPGAEIRPAYWTTRPNTKPWRSSFLARYRLALLLAFKLELPPNSGWETQTV